MNNKGVFGWIALGVIIGIVLVGGGYYLINSLSGDDSLTEQECIELGGNWLDINPDYPGCILPTSDAGKECRDSNECESSCIADLTN